MSTPHSLEPPPHRAPGAGNEINLIEWLIASAKRKKLVFGLPILFAICAALLSLSKPNIYKATTTILPSQQSQSNGMAALNHLVGLAGSTPGVLNIRIPPDLYISMLRSDTVAENLIRRFNLRKGYGTDTFEATRQVLGNNSTIHTGSDGLIAITVRDKDPKRAAQIANAYADELVKLTKRLALTEASHRRLFYERRLQDTKAKLAEVEVELKSANKGAIPVDGRGRAVLEAAARLRAQIAAKEIELAAMQAFVTVNNQEYTRGHQEIGALRADLARLEASSIQKQSEKQATDGGLRILHDLKYYGMLHELLAQQFEAARIDEAKDSSAIQVLDKAVEPERSLEPKRVPAVLLSAVIGLFIAIFWVLLFDVIKLGELLRGRVEKGA
jgi:tyrosine-protein kinase Etk/Wzc